MDRERISDEDVDSFLRGSPDPDSDRDIRLVLFDPIPGVGIDGPILDPPPAVYQVILAPAAQEARHPRIMLNIMLNTILNIMLIITLVTFVASVGAQVLVDVNNEDLEDYGYSCDEEDEDEDEDEVNTHPQEVTPNNEAEVDPAAQHEAVNRAAIVFRHMSITLVQYEDVHPAQEGYASNTSSPTSDTSRATFNSITSPDGAVDLEISPTANQRGVDPTEAVAALDHSPLTSNHRTTTLQQDQAAYGAILAMTSPATTNATTNAIAALTEAPKSPGAESIKEEVDPPSLALWAAVARPRTDDAHSAVPNLEVQVTFPINPNTAEVTTRVRPSLEYVIRDQEGTGMDQEGTGMASIALQKEVELVTPSHDSSSSSTASSSST